MADEHRPPLPERAVDGAPGAVPEHQVGSPADGVLEGAVDGVVAVPALAAPAGVSARSPIGGTEAEQGRHALVACLVFAGAVMSIMQSLVLPLLPEFSEVLGTSPSTTAWLATATLIAGAVSNPVAGRLGDMHGKRRMLLACLGLALVGSVICGFASSLAGLLVGRALQGAGVGALPLAISILRDSVPARQIAPSVALVSATLGLGVGGAPPIAGYLLQTLDWRAVFWVCAGLIVLSVGWVLVMVDESAITTPAPFDTRGAVLFSVALTAVLLVINRSAVWGPLSAPVVALLLVAGVVGRAWWSWERRASAPFIDPHLVTDPPVQRANLAALLTGFAMFSQLLATLTVVVAPVATGAGFGRSVVVAGLCQVPAAAAMMITSPISSRLSRVTSPRSTLVTGCLIIGTGHALRAVYGDELWQIAFGATVVYTGIGFAFGALPTLIMLHVRPSETAAANSINNLWRIVGSALASAAFGAIAAVAVVRVGGADHVSPAGYATLHVLGCLSALSAAAVARTIPVRRTRDTDSDDHGHGHDEVREGSCPARSR